MAFQISGRLIFMFWKSFVRKMTSKNLRKISKIVWKFRKLSYLCNRNKEQQHTTIIESLMKTNILASIFAAVLVLSASCTKVETPEIAAASAARQNVEVNGIIGGTKAVSASLKSEWSENDWIYVSNNGVSSYFKANEGSSFSSFSVCGQLGSWTDGEAYAIFPKSVKLEGGAASFSLSGQNGSINNIDRYFLMTSASTVKNGEVTFAFESQVSVLAIDVNEILYNEGTLTKVVVNGACSSLEISAAAGAISVSGIEGSIEIVNPIVNDGVVYIAVRSESSELSVDLYDSIGSHFFASIEGGLQNGELYDITDAEWNGGLEITFNPSVVDYDQQSI